jgi:hypothetical protein
MWRGAASDVITRSLPWREDKTTWVTSRRHDIQVHRVLADVSSTLDPPRDPSRAGTPRGAGCDNLEPLARYIFVYIIPSISSAATKIYLPFAMSRLPAERNGRRRERSLNRDSSARFVGGETDDGARHPAHLAHLAHLARRTRDGEGQVARGNEKEKDAKTRATARAGPGREKRDGERRHIISAG